MGCDSCQDCSCDNITLPVVAGPTGATGATGPQGPPGAAGTPGIPGTGGYIVLYNDVAQSTTTSGTLALFSPTKAYTLPAGTLSIDGSRLNVKAIFSTSSAAISDTFRTAIYLGGSNYTSLSIPFTEAYWGTGTEAYMVVDLDITRASATSLFINTTTKIANANGIIINTYAFTETSLSVADLDSSPLVMDVRGTKTGSCTLNCNQLSVTHLIA